MNVLLVDQVVLVRKSYDEKRKQRKSKGYQRAWTLKRMDMEAADEPANMKGNRARLAAEQQEADHERFLEEIEEDSELRKVLILLVFMAYTCGGPSSYMMWNY